MQRQAEAEVVPDEVRGGARKRRTAGEAAPRVIGQRINPHEPGAPAAQPVTLSRVARRRCGKGQGVAGPGQGSVIGREAQVAVSQKGVEEGHG